MILKFYLFAFPVGAHSANFQTFFIEGKYDLKKHAEFVILILQKLIYKKKVLRIVSDAQD